MPWWSTATHATAAVSVLGDLQDRLVGPDYGVNGSESARAADFIRREFSGLSPEQDMVVFSAEGATVDDPAYQATIEAVLAAARTQPGVSMVTGLLTRQLPPTRRQAGKSPPTALRWDRG